MSLTGRRRPILVLFQSSSEVDGQDGPVKTWATHGTFFVNMEPQRGTERDKADELESSVTHMVRGDYYDLNGVTPHMRMIYSPGMEYGNSPPTIPDASRVFDILAVMPADNDNGDSVLKVEEEGRTYAEITG